VMVFGALQGKMEQCQFLTIDPRFMSLLLGEWVAPMMDWPIGCRYFIIVCSRHALLYTEMVTTGADSWRCGQTFALWCRGASGCVATRWQQPKDLAHCATLGEAVTKSISIAAVQANGCGGARSALPMGNPTWLLTASRPCRATF
jgi:hypothetical protein